MRSDICGLWSWRDSTLIFLFFSTPIAVGDKLLNKPYFIRETRSEEINYSSLGLVVALVFAKECAFCIMGEVQSLACFSKNCSQGNHSQSAYYQTRIIVPRSHEFKTVVSFRISLISNEKKKAFVWWARSALSYGYRK